MGKLDTEALEKKLENTHADEIKEYLNEHADSFLSDDRPFAEYMREKIREKNMKQQDVFLFADVPERYGYKLLSEEKRTRKRDVILRICYAAEFTLAETQQALRIYGMPELYAKVARDAVLMISFNSRPGSIIEVNKLLKDNDMEPLKTSGVQE